MGSSTGTSGPFRRVAVAFFAVALVGSVAAACTIPPPPDPFGLKARLGEDEVELVWQGQAGVTTYQVQELQPDGTWNTLVTVTGTAAEVTGFTPGTWVRLRVRPAPPAAGPSSGVVRVFYAEPELPVIRIDTQNSAPILDRENYVQGTMTFDPNGSAHAAWSGPLEIRGRGNQTWTKPKKPYRLRLNSAANLMGMGSNRHWVLLANYMDRSHLRTWATAQMGYATDLEWTPDFAHVEVILNGEYVGVYQLTEQIRRDPARVNIESLSASDTTEPTIHGGYLLEINGRRVTEGAIGFRTGRAVELEVKEPDPPNSQQLAWISNYVAQFEQRLFAPNFTDPFNGYRPYLDTGAFVDHYLVQEAVKNQDAFAYSTYISKKRAGNLVFGPLWDFDNTMGNPLSQPAVQDPTGWIARTRMPWTTRLFQDPALNAETAARWAELEPAFRAVADSLPAAGAPLQGALSIDAARWNLVPSASDNPEFLRDWLNQRLDWIDSQLDPAP